MTETDPPPPPATLPNPATLAGNDDPLTFPARRPWILIGVFAVCVTALEALNRLIGAVESAGQRSYEPRVFTKFRFDFWKTDELRDAMALWRETQHATPKFDVERLLALHTGIDALLFVPAYCLLLYFLLRRVGATKHVAIVTAFVTALADWAETGTTWFFLVYRHLEPSRAIWIIQTLSCLKWLAVAWSVVTIVVLWIHQRRDETGAVRLRLRGYALTSITVIVAVFAAAIALPAGGPLDQIPDVLRAQLSPSVSWVTRILSGVALALLAASVATGATLACDPRANPVPRKLVRNPTVLGVAVGISVMLILLNSLLEHRWRAAALAPTVVIGAIWIAAMLATKVGASNPDHLLHDVWANMHPINAYAVARYAGALAGVIVVAGGIGLLRAAFPPLVVGVGPGILPWWVVSVIAVLVAVGGGIAAQRIVIFVLQPTDTVADPTKRRRVAVGVMIAAVTFAFATLLITFPDYAGRITTTGVIAIAFAAFALVVGWLAWVAREWIAWEATQTLGIGVHTPWLAILVAVWLVASLLNTAGVYHDARVISTAPQSARYPSLDSAFTAWFGAQNARECTAVSGDIPLLLVAAPGGGIRAAYWTAAGLDKLVGTRGSRCATTPIFAMSGVSGGSIGIASWIAAAARGRDGRVAVEGMADDRALASVAVGLLFRDELQPLVTLATTWRDRAALLEDGWERAPGSPLAGVMWDSLGNGLSWIPVIVLNGSSVNDGCRVLIANIGGLPAQTEHDCNESAHVGAGGAVSSAIDGIAGTHARDDSSCTAGRAQLRAATAALLSARFPFVSPSGALIHCSPDTSQSAGAKSVKTETYVVDGGYHENSGILTLLQMWRAIEPLVRKKNGESARQIVPWLVVIDNHYRSAARAAPQGRTLELFVPLKALTSGSVASQPALEQMAWKEIAGDGARCKSGDSSTSVPPVSAEAPHGCVVVIAPQTSPGVGAPLGWVLSEMSRKNMDDQMNQRFATGPRPDTLLMNLRRLIDLPGPSTAAQSPIKP